MKSQSEPVEQLQALDDEQMAHFLAKQYEDQGIDPSHAYAKDDDFDFRTEFGI